MLHALVSHPFEALSREQLHFQIHGSDRQPGERGIDVLISQLRRIVEDDPRHPRYLQTVWGLGYAFAPDGQLHAGTRR
ncbi:winged helix-turn-helix domain-containing protein [Acidihalobacter ferrooxydans]|uniref:winged helix-turn-helix domain-containing protein n=1 Tax=Acidihalobacter ferrooxydans TaxID=1765967 RepID=UPI001E6025E5|nr:winged helix-turn-helix domain-containing protein [Acidihalobacter ferrooxydans]